MKEEQKSYHTRKYGFRFKIVINGTTTIAIIDEIEHQGEELKFTGIARLHEPDKYDPELGVLIAMKSAVNKYYSTCFGSSIRLLVGWQNKMKGHNKSLSQKIEKRRDTLENTELFAAI